MLCFQQTFLVALNAVPLSSNKSAVEFLLGTFVTSPCSLDLLATALQLDVFQLQVRFRDIFRNSLSECYEPKLFSFCLFLLLLVCFVPCYIAVVRSLADSVIDLST
jgi:hypothetical protein